MRARVSPNSKPWAYEHISTQLNSTQQAGGGGGGGKECEGESPLSTVTFLLYNHHHHPYPRRVERVNFHFDPMFNPCLNFCTVCVLLFFVSIFILLLFGNTEERFVFIFFFYAETLAVAEDWPPSCLGSSPNCSSTHPHAHVWWWRWWWLWSMISYNKTMINCAEGWLFSVSKGSTQKKYRIIWELFPIRTCL